MPLKDMENYYRHSLSSAVVLKNTAVISYVVLGTGSLCYVREDRKKWQRSIKSVLLQAANV